nr:MAG TPA: hypothetical protein [Caudoviricetes sp.]
MDDKELAEFKEKIEAIYDSAGTITPEEYIDSFAWLAKTYLTLKNKENISPEQFGKMCLDIMKEIELKKYLRPDARFQKKKENQKIDICTRLGIFQAFFCYTIRKFNNYNILES